jgi:glycosyltransferase involved in cell wall biosynthesis
VSGSLDVSVVIPCLDEVGTVGGVVEGCIAALDELGRTHEVILADNGSTDGSREAAVAAGARIVDASHRKGAGAATRLGVEDAKGRIVVLLDADGEHDPAQMPRLLEAAEANDGALVLGSRYRGKFDRGASSLPNRLLGTPVLTFLINTYFGTKITDCNTGYRALSRDAFLRIDVSTPGFEYCSEMIARAALLDIPIVEVPIDQRAGPAGRQPHLRRMRDGWRHLKFILLHAPDRVLLRPGILSTVVGAVLFFPQITGRVELGPFAMDIHLMILGVLLLMIGVEMIGSAIVCATIAGAPVAPAGRTSRKLGRFFTLDKMLPVGGAIALAGLGADVAVVAISASQGWQGITEPRLALVGTTGIGIAIQILVLSFVHSVVGQYRPVR